MIFFLLSTYQFLPKLIMWTQILTIVFIWLAFAVGCYILSYLIAYMHDKAPGQQTLLDVLYSQMFILYIAIGLIFSISFTLQVVEHRSITSTILVGYGSSTLIFCACIHFAICGFLRCYMIFAPEELNEFPDDTIEIIVW